MLDPPRYVPYPTALPAAFIRMRKPVGPFVRGAGWKPAAVSDRSVDCVAPTTYARPLASTAIAWPLSYDDPPYLVEYKSAEPVGLSFTTNASTPPRSVD